MSHLQKTTIPRRLWFPGAGRTSKGAESKRSLAYSIVRSGQDCRGLVWKETAFRLAVHSRAGALRVVGTGTGRSGCRGPALKLPGPRARGLPGKHRTVATCPVAAAGGLRDAEHRPGQQGERQDLAPQAIPGRSGRVKAEAGGHWLCRGWRPARGGSLLLERRWRGSWRGSLEGVQGAGAGGVRGGSGSGSDLPGMPGLGDLRRCRPFPVRGPGCDQDEPGAGDRWSWETHGSICSPGDARTRPA